MLRAFILSFLTTSIVVFTLVVLAESDLAIPPVPAVPWWSIQSVDTMKYSRDLSREELQDESFDTVIDKQLSDIAGTGATYVAIATPYDDEFYPILTRWVIAARKKGLHVWFRGNLSGWERWFNYPAIDRSNHLKGIRQFITTHPEIFQKGDIFTPCPECENGGPGDPRKTGDIRGHRQFLIDEYKTSQQAFKDIGKSVTVGYFSMNYDVATLIMDAETTQALGGIVTLDHYVYDPTKLDHDITAIAQKSGGKVFLGEFGAPIPDIHGDMTAHEQYIWIDRALFLLSHNTSLVGINYWVNTGGSTELWSEQGERKEAVTALEAIFVPKILRGTLINRFGRPIQSIGIATPYHTVYTDKNGTFSIPILSDEETISIVSDEYNEHTLNIHDVSKSSTVVLSKKQFSFFEWFFGSLRSLIAKLQQR